MSFWEYLDKDNLDNERFGNTKRIFIRLFIFLVVPILIYTLIQWNPVIGAGMDGEQPGLELGIWIVLIMYWTCAFLSHERYEGRKRLNQLIDKLLDEQESKHILDVIRQKQDIIKEDAGWGLNEYGEERVKWFGIK